MLLVYVIGLPVAAFHRVWRVQVTLRSQHAAAAAAAGGAAAPPAPAAAASASAPKSRKRKRRESINVVQYDKNNQDYIVYGMLFSAFEDMNWWWEFTVAGRKITLAMFGVFGVAMGTMQVHLTLLMIVFVLTITAFVRPFTGDYHRLLLVLEIASLTATFLTLWAGSIFNEHPKCQDPLLPEGVTLPWCDALAIIIGLLDICFVVVVVFCYVWLKI